MYSTKRKYNGRRKKFLVKKTDSTIKHVKNHLWQYIKEVKGIAFANPQKMMHIWSSVLDEKYCNMTKAIGFRDGILSVKVYNSSLYASLKQENNKIFIKKIKAVMPESNIKEVKFLLG